MGPEVYLCRSGDAFRDHSCRQLPRYQVPAVRDALLLRLAPVVQRANPWNSDVGCKTVANMIKGKTPEEIRKLFNIVNDFTPEEEVSVFHMHLYELYLILLSSRHKSRKKTCAFTLLIT